MRWQAGLFLFTQNYKQDAVNNFSPFVVSQFIPFPVSQHSPQSALDDRGVGVYGQGTFTFAKKLDLVVGARGDRENKNGRPEHVLHAGDCSARTSSTPRRTSPTCRRSSRPPIALHPRQRYTARYREDTKPAASTRRRRWERKPTIRSTAGTTKAGVKTTALGDRLSASIAAFFIDWSDVQVNIPNPGVPGQFFIGNTAGATSNGVEFELHARPEPGLDLFGGTGFTHARFSDGSISQGVNVSGNKLAERAELHCRFRCPVLRVRCATLSRSPHAPRRSATAATSTTTRTRRARMRTPSRTCARAFAASMRSASSGSATPSIRPTSPVAFPYPGLAPSGFVGENGRAAHVRGFARVSASDSALIQHKGHKGHQGQFVQSQERFFLCVLRVLCV